MIVDTTFLIDLARGDPGARAAAEQAATSSEALMLPTPALARFWEAVERSRRPIREKSLVEDLLLAQPSIAFEGEHAIVAARFLAAASASGVPLDPFDAMVAAIAHVEDAPLLTRNARDFERIPDLRVRTY